MRITAVVKKLSLVAVTAGMATAVPLAPASASAAPCYEAIQFCKYHSSAYPSFAECVAEESIFLCPGGVAAQRSLDDLLATRPKAAPHI